MASISTDSAGNRTVQFKGWDGRRKTLYFGKAPMAATRTIVRHVEAINAARISGATIDPEEADWLKRIGDRLHKKLAAIGLVEAREIRIVPTLRPFLADFIAKRKGTVAAATIVTLEQSAARLTDYFGDVKLDAINAGQADEWLLWMTTDRDYAKATIGKTVKHARQFFRAAVRLELIGTNPFADLKAPSQANDERKEFVSREVSSQVLEILPGHEWKLVFALSRYGGLRCPSEHLRLTWRDIDWAGGRFTVRSTKTGERLVPLFPELRPYLEAAFDEAADGAVHVLTRRRASAQQWGMLLRRMLQAAGIARWERIFHNLRASCETELAAEFPLHVVCAWLGNSESIAKRHYLQVREEDFEKALQKALHENETSLDKTLHDGTLEAARTLEMMQSAKKVPEACKSQGG